MNTKGAKLSELPTFKKAIKKHTGTIRSLAEFKLEEVKTKDSRLENAIDSLFGLFDDDQIVNTNLPLVTFAKTLHFFLPDLFMPIDKKYSPQFFYRKPPYKSENYGLPELTKTFESQKKCFCQVFEQFHLFAQKHHGTLKAQVDNSSRWNRNIPKVIDNIIIGYVSANME